MFRHHYYISHFDGKLSIMCFLIETKRKTMLIIHQID